MKAYKDKLLMILNYKGISLMPSFVYNGFNKTKFDYKLIDVIEIRIC